MPIYSYLCPNGHRTERCNSMAEHQSNKMPCDTCMEPAQQEYFPLGTIGGQISDATRRLLEVPFGRRRASEFVYTKDIDAHLAKREKEIGLGGKGLTSNVKD